MNILNVKHTDAQVQSISNIVWSLDDKQYIKGVETIKQPAAGKWIEK